MAHDVKPGGRLPVWNMSDLPEPPPFTGKNILAVIGPGAIALSMSIGGGEWLLGPATVVRYGFSVMWIVTLGILLQLALSMEFYRYTLYTGEPTVNGFMRARPGPVFWAVVYLVLALCQVGWPAWAANSASTVFALFTGGLPDRAVPAHGTAVGWIGIVTFLATVAIVAVGGKIERMLEIVNGFMVIFIVGFLLVVDILFVPARVWWEAIVGHVALGADGAFRPIPPGADWVLLGAFAGFAGSGGIGNLWTSNWMRDKGFGMGAVVGYISSAVGGKQVKVSPVGSVFPTTPENLSRWKTWLRYLKADQAWVWAGGCFLGMYLNVILAAAVVPPGTEMSGLKSGAIQAEFLARHGGAILFYLTLLNGFWILFGTQLCVVDGLVRFATDIVWTGSAVVRRVANGDIRKVYYGLLAVFTVWGCVAIQLLEQFRLMEMAANVAGFILVVGGIHILILNRRALPRVLWSPWWQRAAVVLGILFYTFFSTMNAIGVGVKQGWWTSPF